MAESNPNPNSSDSPESAKPDDQVADAGALAEEAGIPEEDAEDQGPGWMPAIMAGTVILGIVMFITCSVTTWLLFQKRTELAIRTLDGTFIPIVEQSLIAPDEKEETLRTLSELSKELKRGKYENWQSGGVMTRLTRLPIAQWGDLSAVEAFVKKQPATFQKDAAIHLSRLRRGVELDELTAIDFDYVLETVTKYDDSLRGQSLMEPMTKENVAVVISRADEVADRADVAEKVFDDVWLNKLIVREIKAGTELGSH